ARIRNFHPEAEPLVLKLVELSAVTQSFDLGAQIIPEVYVLRPCHPSDILTSAGDNRADNLEVVWLRGDECSYLRQQRRRRIDLAVRKRDICFRHGVEQLKLKARLAFVPEFRINFAQELFAAGS